MKSFGTARERILLNMFADRRHSKTITVDNILSHASGDHGALACLTALVELMNTGCVEQANVFGPVRLFLTEKGMAEGQKVWDAE